MSAPVRAAHAGSPSGAERKRPAQEGLRRPGYSSPAIRAWLTRRRVQDLILTRADEDTLGRRTPDFDREVYRGHNVVERCVGGLKECRRLATRYEKLAVNFAAMITLAIIVMDLKLPL